MDKAIQTCDGTGLSSVTRSFESKTKQILGKKDTAEAKKNELNRAFSSYIDDLHNAFNVIIKEFETEKEKMFKIKKKADSELFRNYFGK